MPATDVKKVGQRYCTPAQWIGNMHFANFERGRPTDGEKSTRTCLEWQKKESEKGTRKIETKFT